MENNSELIGNRKKRLEELARQAGEDPLIKAIIEGKDSHRWELVFQKKLPFKCHGLAYSPANKRLAIASDDYAQIIEIDYENHDLIYKDKIDHPTKVNAVTFLVSQHKLVLATGSDDNILRLFTLFTYDVETTSRPEVKKIPIRGFKTIDSIASVGEREHLVLGSKEGLSIGSIDSVGFKPVFENKKSQDISALSFNQGCLAVGKSDSLMIYECETLGLYNLKKMDAIECPSKIVDVSFSPSAKYVAVALKDWPVRIFEISTDETKLFAGFGFNATGVEFSLDGKYLAIADNDLLYMYTRKENEN